MLEATNSTPVKRSHFNTLKSLNFYDFGNDFFRRCEYHTFYIGWSGPLSSANTSTMIDSIPVLRIILLLMLTVVLADLRIEFANRCWFWHTFNI